VHRSEGDKECGIGETIEKIREEFDLGEVHSIVDLGVHVRMSARSQCQWGWIVAIDIPYVVICVGMVIAMCIVISTGLLLQTIPARSSDIATIMHRSVAPATKKSMQRCSSHFWKSQIDIWPGEFSIHVTGNGRISRSKAISF